VSQHKARAQAGQQRLAAVATAADIGARLIAARHARRRQGRGSNVKEDAKLSTSSPAQRLGLLSLLAAIYTWLLVVFGGIVRITGSGMGCGDDWPRCNGEWIPPFTFETVIEYVHRLLAAGIGLVVLTVFVYAIVKRQAPRVSGRGGQLRPLLLASALFVFQALLGAVTVWLELPASVTIAHFVTAMLFMATLIVAAARGDAFGPTTASADARAPRIATWALTTAAVGLVVVAFGAMTANTPGAPQACTGFPLCNGRWLPEPGAVTVEIHWAHRVAAFVLLLIAGAAARLATRGGARNVARAAITTFALIVVQLVVAAVLVLSELPQSLQATHLAVGAAVWFALAVWASLARLHARTSLDRTRASG
jgi:heme A synthase